MLKPRILEEKPDSADPTAADTAVGESAAAPAISVEGVAQVYRIWRSPSARLASPILQGISRIFSSIPKATSKMGNFAKSPYRDFHALRDISFRVEVGETVGIIGANGSGKTTLLEIIAGTLQATEGRTETRGRVAALLELGSGFNLEFTGRENVYLTASIHGLSKEGINQKYEAILEFAGIGDFIDQPLKTYSSGMVLRLAFAVNSLVDPDILIIDEALAVGDIFFQQKCFRHLKNEMRGKTRLLVTHDLHTLANVVDRVLILDHGRLAFDGETKDEIALYTKMLVDETYGNSITSIGPSLPSARERRSKQRVPWVETKPETLSGRKGVIIQRAALTNDELEPALLATPEEELLIHAVIHVTRAPMPIICGYMVHDRFGEDICGETNFPLSKGRYTIPECGSYYYRIRFRWPHLKPAEYTMTIGVGEGDQVHNHVIQCWAHNVFKITAASPDFEIHGLFANPMEEFVLEKWDHNSGEPG